MESGSRADTPSPRPSYRLADFIGTLIAVLTLTIPVVAIAYYSSSPPSLLPAYTPTNDIRSR